MKRIIAADTRWIWVACLFLLISDSAAAKVELAKNELFPLSSIARIQKRAFLSRVEKEVKLTFEISSKDGYMRTFRIYVDGTQATVRMVAGADRATVDLSKLLRHPGTHVIVFEIYYGGHKPWKLNRATLHGVDGKITP